MQVENLSSVTVCEWRSKVYCIYRFLTFTKRNKNFSNTQGLQTFQGCLITRRWICTGSLFKLRIQPTAFIKMFPRVVLDSHPFLWLYYKISLKSSLKGLRRFCGVCTGEKQSWLCCCTDSFGMKVHGCVQRWKRNGRIISPTARELNTAALMLMMCVSRREVFWSDVAPAGM